jgi:hypothetical protein
LQLAEKGIATRRNRTYRSAALFRAHDEREAQRLLDGGLAAAGLSAKELDSLPGSDVRKVALANLLLERTVARQSWIAQKLAMCSAANKSGLADWAHRGIMLITVLTGIHSTPVMRIV